MKIFEIDFKPLYPVPHGLIIVANNEEEALKIARETTRQKNCSIMNVFEIDKPKVIFYENGDY